MNTRKAYQMLVVVLFFAFISLISRSIIYLILSVAIAIMIISLLTNAKKMRSTYGVPSQKHHVEKDQNISLHKFLVVTAVMGGVLIGYGSLAFKENSIFHQLITVPKESYIAIPIIIAGFVIGLSSLYFIIREMLSDGIQNGNSAQFCGECSTKAKKNHNYCHKCGAELTKR